MGICVAFFSCHKIYIYNIRTFSVSMRGSLKIFEISAGLSFTPKWKVSKSLQAIDWRAGVRPRWKLNIYAAINRWKVRCFYLGRELCILSVKMNQIHINSLLPHSINSWFSSRQKATKLTTVRYQRQILFPRVAYQRKLKTLSTLALD